jgi:hypothetical protein
VREKKNQRVISGEREEKSTKDEYINTRYMAGKFLQFREV